MYSKLHSRLHQDIYCCIRREILDWYSTYAAVWKDIKEVCGALTFMQ